MGNRRRRKKKCSCNKANPSSMPCGQCIKKAAKKQSMAKEKNNQRKPKRNKKIMTDLASGSVREKPTYAVLGTTFLSVLHPGATEMFASLKSGLENASITDLVILVPFWASSRHAKRRIASILASRNASWATNYLIYQWPHESVEAFVLRAATTFEVTHFFDVDMDVLGSIAKSPNHLQRLHLYKPDEPDAWLKVRGWITKTCPSYFPALEKAQEAGVIIASP